MFDPKSRYVKLQTETYIRDGEQLVYATRRFLPVPESIDSVQNVTVAVGDRMDTISTRTIGDPELFWRICDANYVMYPLEVTNRPGTVLRVPAPGG